MKLTPTSTVRRTYNAARRRFLQANVEEERLHLAAQIEFLERVFDVRG